MFRPSVTSRLGIRAYQPTAADKAFKAAQQKKAIKELWLLITAILACLLLVRVLRFTLTSLFGRGRYSRRSVSSASTLTEKTEKDCPELVFPGRTGRASWRRIPAALATGFRIVAFRAQVPLGIGTASIAELFFICGYIATMLSLTLTNSEFVLHYFSRAVLI